MTAYQRWSVLLLANLNALPFDFVARQKVQGQHLNWYIVEQLPVVPPEAFEHRIGAGAHCGLSCSQQVLALTYTAHDMEAFARDEGYDGLRHSSGTKKTAGTARRGSMPCSSTSTASAARMPTTSLGRCPILKQQDEAKLALPARATWCSPKWPPSRQAICTKNQSGGVSKAHAAPWPQNFSLIAAMALKLTPSLSRASSSSTEKVRPFETVSPRSM